jgi:hypothetical protein
MLEPSAPDEPDESDSVGRPDPRSQSGQSGVPESDPDRVGQVFDAVSYAIATTVLFAGVSAIFGLAVGSAVAPAVKYGLFVFGWLAFGYGTVMLWPKAAWKEQKESKVFDALVESPSKRPDTKFQRLAQRLPPARFRQIPDEERLSTGARVFFAAVVMMVTSIILEQAFGVGP